MEGGPRGIGEVDAGFRGGKAARGAAVAEGVPPNGNKKGGAALAEKGPPNGKKKPTSIWEKKKLEEQTQQTSPTTGTQRKPETPTTGKKTKREPPPKKMSKKDRKAWEKAEQERQEKERQERLAQQQRADQAVKEERARVEAAMRASREAETAARLKQLIARGNEQMAQQQFAEAQGTFQTAMTLHGSDQVNAELEDLCNEAHDCREANELAAEAELFIEMESPKLAVQRLQDAISFVPNNRFLLDKYTKALADAQEAVVQMEAREKAEEEELERLHEEELRLEQELQLFEQMEGVRHAAKQDLERAQNRRECREVANLVQKTLALDHDQKFKKRGDLQTIAQRAIKKARAFKLADAAATLLDDGFFEDAVEKYLEALSLDPLNPIIQAGSDKATSMFDKQQIAAAQEEKPDEKIERKKKKVQLLVEQAHAQTEEAEYYAAAATLESALAARKYLDAAQVESLEQMFAKAEKQGEAKQLCLRGFELIMRGKTQAGLEQYAQAIELDPDNERWPSQRDAAMADRKAKEETEADDIASAKSTRKDRKAAQQAANQAAQRDKLVEKMSTSATIQFKSQKYTECARTCAQALRMIDEVHPKYEELTELQTQSDGIINVTDMTARSQELIDTKDYTRAKAMLEDALAVAPTGYPIEGLQAMLSQTTDNLQKQQSEFRTKLALAEAQKKQELAEQAQAAAAAAIAAEAQMPGATAGRAAAGRPQPKPRVTEKGLGTFRCDNDINVKGTVPLGKVKLQIAQVLHVQPFTLSMHTAVCR